MTFYLRRDIPASGIDSCMRKYLFPAIMFAITILTAVKYRSIVAFKNESREFTFVVSADRSEMSDVKSKLENYTYQSVDDEMIEEGLYRLTVRCPPDKIGLVKGLMLKFSDKN
jgi:hypothetical protein